jgi:hypothetical protein
MSPERNRVQRMKLDTNMKHPHRMRLCAKVVVVVANAPKNRTAEASKQRMCMRPGNVCEFMAWTRTAGPCHAALDLSASTSMV